MKQFFSNYKFAFFIIFFVLLGSFSLNVSSTQALGACARNTASIWVTTSTGNPPVAFPTDVTIHWTSDCPEGPYIYGLVGAYDSLVSQNGSFTKTATGPETYDFWAYSNSCSVTGQGGLPYCTQYDIAWDRFAYLSALPTYTVTPSANTGCSISPSTPQTVNSGSTPSFTVTPSNGYTISSVGGTCGGSPSGASASAVNYTTNAVTGNCTVVVPNCTPTTSGNQPPVVNAGNDITITQPASSVTVTGTASDPDDAISSTFWTAVGYPATPSFSTPGNLSTNISGLTSAGIYTFRLTADDSGSPVLSAYDEMTVRVLRASAGPYTVTGTAGANGSISPSSQSVNAGNTTTFTVTPNGGYTATMGGTCVLGSPTSSSTAFTYTTGAINADCTVTASFATIPVNLPPILAIDQADYPPAFSLPTSSSYLSAVASDPDGTVVSMQWTNNYQCGGCPVPNISTPNSINPGGGGASVTSATNITGMTSAGSYNFTLRATDNLGAFTVRNIIIVVYPASMSGTLTSSSCTIPSGSSSCSASLTWTTTNPVASSSVTNNGSATPAGTSGLNGTQLFNVPYLNAFNGVTSFYLYNNGASLATGTITTTCAGSSTWNGIICNPSGGGGPYTVTGTAGANGSISPSSRSVNAGNTTTFTVTPNGGYTASASGCSGSLSGTTYTTGAINANCTVTASFTSSGGSLPDLMADNPLVVSAVVGTPVTFSSVVRNVGSVPTGASFYTFFQLSDTPNGGGAFSPISFNLTSPLNSNSNVTVISSPHTFLSVGNYSVRTCADINSLYTSEIVEGVNGASPTEMNNCSGWTNIAVTAALPMSGTLTVTAPTCTIPLGGSSCTQTLSWTTTNPVATSAVTDNGTASTSPASLATGNSGTNVSFTIPYNNAMSGVNTFYLYNNGVMLNSPGLTVTTNCIGGSTWNTSSGTCVANAVPSVSSPTDSAVTSTGATLGANVTSLGSPASISARGTCWGTSPSPTLATGTCLAASGTTTGVFTHARTGMPSGTPIYYSGYATNSTGTGYSADGTFTTTAAVGPIGTISVTGCTIPNGASTCSASVSWTTANLTASPTEVTRNNPDFTHVSWLTSGTNVSNTVNYGPTGFFLYHNGLPLAASPILDITCASGVWNSTSSTCEAGGPTTMSGTITPGPITSCSIPIGSNSCTINLTWNTVNPVATSAITSATGTPSPGNSLNSGTQTFNAPYDPTGVIFYLYNNGVKLYETMVVADCASGAHWDVSSCVANLGATPSITISANPIAVIPPSTSTITWSSTDADSCSGVNFNTGGATSGSAVVSPLVTTTYTITCVNNTFSTQYTVSTKVTVGSGGNKKPDFIEN